MTLQFKSGLIVLAVALLGWTSYGVGQTPQPAPVPGPGHTSENGSENRPESSSGSSSEQPGAASAGGQLAGQRSSGTLSGSISGTVVDQSGAVVGGARVRLTRTGTGDAQSLNQEVLAGADGQFSFANIAPGPFLLTVTVADFAPRISSGILHSGENYIVPQIALAVAASVTDVEVGLSQTEVAEEQIQVEEKQRVLGVLPNFYVSYVANAAPLNSKQKFKLALRTVVDPFTWVFVGGAAGVEQAQNHFAEYGQGAQGYGKRFGADYADTVAGTFIGGAILPSLLKQDPRYFYKGSGSKTSRALYAIANAVICKGDNGRWQANYSNILGSLAAGGISNLYYPDQDRNGAGLTFENGALGIGATAVANLFQEFVIRKLTPKVPGSAKP
ncbi:MAG: carboxypeptidase-like regulatory domain-containing protein [Terriglobales bacterium]